MIKDLVVKLTQITVKSVVMDIVVADIPARFGMLLSRSWGSNIRGSIKLDLTYTTIPILGGEEMRLHRESRFFKIVMRVDCSGKAPVYWKERELSFLLLEEDDFILEETQVKPAVQLDQ